MSYSFSKFFFVKLIDATYKGNLIVLVYQLQLWLRLWNSKGNVTVQSILPFYIMVHKASFSLLFLK